LDANLRDCNWVEQNGYYFSDSGLKNEAGSLIKGVCVPKYQPGFNRDGTNNVIGGDSCALAGSICYVKMQKPIGGQWDCNKNDIGSNCSCVLGANGNYDGGATWAAGLNSCTQRDYGTKR
jgi:hypothetical protein